MKPPTAEKFFRILKAIQAAPTAGKVRQAALSGLRELAALVPFQERREMLEVLQALVVEQCNHRLQALASRRPARAAAPLREDFQRLRGAGLTRRECEVLAWIARGKRDGEIGAILGIAPRTVGKHIEHLLQKLQAETRTGAVNLARNQLRSQA